MSSRARLGSLALATWSRCARPAVAPKRAAARVVASSSSRGASSSSARDAVASDVAETSSDAESTAARSGGYPFADIEARWQKHWAENKTFKTPDQIDTTKPKFYALDMFPYPRRVVAASRRVPALAHLNPKPSDLNPKPSDRPTDRSIYPPFERWARSSPPSSLPSTRPP